MIESLKNQEQILWEVALKFGPLSVSKLLSEGYVLTVDVLELLHCFNCYPDQILDCVQACKNYSDAAALYKWLCAYIGQQEAEDFFLQKCNFDENLLQYVSASALERSQCWNELARRKADDILYKHGVYDKMSPEGLYKYRLLDYYFQKADFINPNHIDVLEYLAHAGKWDIVSKSFSFNSSNKIMLDFLVKYKQFAIIASKNSMYLTNFPEGIAFLQKAKNNYILAQAKLYDKVDWDEYLQSGTIRPTGDAEAAQQWDALMRNHRHWVLLKHFKLWRFIKSFF